MYLRHDRKGTKNLDAITDLIHSVLASDSEGGGVVRRRPAQVNTSLQFVVKLLVDRATEYL